MLRLTQNGRSHQHGLTLIELMVSLAVSLVVLSALTYVYVGSRGAYRSNEALARVQENGRFAMELLTREIREAGYLGCLSRGISVNDIRKGPATPMDWANSAIRGFEDTVQNDSTWANSNWTDTDAGTLRTSQLTVTVKPNSDVVRLAGLVGAPARVLEREKDPTNANFKVDKRPKSLDNKDPFIVTNCERATIANALNSYQTDTVTHSGGGNVHGEFLIEPNYTFESRSLLFVYDVVDFFIARPSASQPWSLYRYSQANATAEPLVENIEDMDATFGVDTNDDGSADVYQDATTVTGPPINWKNVVSVRLLLLARSTDNAAVLQPQSLYFRVASGVPDIVPATNDRYLRQTFSSTIALRNRLP